MKDGLHRAGVGIRKQPVPEEIEAATARRKLV